MSNRLVTSNGESVKIESVIEALETAPDKEEILQALKDLRRDKVKKALGDTVKAAQFDRDQVLSDFINDGEKSERTQETYLREVGHFLSWLDRASLHVLQVTRADVNRFKRFLLERYAANSVRLALASCSSLYTYLEAERYIERSPFANIKYPRKVYKKAVTPDQGKPVPVMSEEEYQTIVEALEQKTTAAGKRIYEKRSRESARRLLPVVHFRGTYGLRIGDVLTVRIEGEERFSYQQKGGKVRQKHLRPESRSVLKRVGMVRNSPFADMVKVTIQGALRRLVMELTTKGEIRHPYSAHDFRRFYALKVYEETGDIYEVKEALGHATVAVTEVYLSGLGALHR